MSRFAILVLGGTLGLAAALWAQVNVGSISGSVIDPSKAAVAEAQVVLTNEQTGVVWSTSTGAAGNYLFTPLQPGLYRIAVEAPGFKKIERGGLLLQVGEKLGVDFALEIGAVGESIQVTAETPLLVTTNANVGQVIDQQKIMELPLPGRDTIRLVQLAPGVGGRSSSLGDLRLGGGRIRHVDYFVDGSPTQAAGDARATALPSIDAIQEFRVDTNNLSAEYGRLSGGAINIQTRSGTNEFHGALYDFARDDAFNANGWDANRRGSPKGSFMLHQFGFTFGGPVQIPRIYSGRNRTFFFFNYDAERRNNHGSLSYATVPTERERGGDFSQTLNSQGNRVTVYDPMTYNPATNARHPFPADRIPEARFDPVARYMLPLWSLPNLPGDPVTMVNNFAAVSSGESGRNDFTLRLDQNFGSNHRIYLRLTRNDSTDTPAMWRGPGTPTWNTWHTQTGSTLNWTWTVGPTLIVTAQLGAAPRDFIYYPVYAGFDPTKAPITENARRELDPRFIPAMTFERVAGVGVTWHTTWLRERYFIGSTSATKVWPRHTLKFGYEIRPIFLNNNESAAPSGQAAFGGAWTGLNQQAPFAQQGSGFASFLLGLPNNFSFDSALLGWAVSFRNHAAYVTDDFKATRKLTLNLGLRWEYEAPMTERYNRLDFIDYQADNGYRVNPNYNFQRDVIDAGQLPAGSPEPDLRSPFLGGIGLVASPSHPGRNGTQPRYRNFGPRLGLAYQIADRTVLRTGLGVIYSGYTGNASGSSSLSLQPFFRTAGNALITTDNGRTIAATLSNPFPNNIGIIAGTNDPAHVLSRSLGSSYYGYEYNHQPSYEISYNLGLQRQVGKWLFDVSFIGNRGVHLYRGSNPWINQMDPKYLALGALLERPVANPFFGAGLPDNGNLLTLRTIPYKYLLSSHPHLVGNVRVLQQASGNSQYLAGFFRIERRLASGLSLLISYSVSKLIEDSGGKAGDTLPQDGRSYLDVRGLSAQDLPQKLVVTYLYELPVGKGKRVLGDPRSIGPKVLDKVIGGWKIGGFTMLTSGYPVGISQSDGFPAGLGFGTLRPTLVGDYHADTSVRDALGFPTEVRVRYVKPEAFAVTSRYAFGTVPRLLPDLRQPRHNETDLAIMKEFRFSESKYLQVRLEGQNFFNHPVFGGLGTNIQSANFGCLGGTQNSPRSMQFGGRFVF